MRMRVSGPLLAAGMLAAGCVSTPELRPPATAATTPSGSQVAEGEGVRLIARGDAWKGNPSNLPSLVTPVQVRIENKSGHPLRIDYEDFVLVGGSQFEYAALSPFQLREESQTGVGGSGFQGSAAPTGAVVVAPVHWNHFGHGWRMGGLGFYGPGWYDSFYGPYMYGYGVPPPEPLPTRDMTRAALPKGTLAPGGTLAGFLYFQSVGEREGQVTLQAKLVDAVTGKPFGTLSIPFDVRS